MELEVGSSNSLLALFKISSFQKCQMAANNGKFKLRDILSVPMQRILKYPLLLNKLVSETQMVSFFSLFVKVNGIFFF